MNINFKQRSNQNSVHCLSCQAGRRTVYICLKALALASRIYEGWGLGLGLAYIRGLRPRPWPRVYTRVEASALASRIYEGWGLGLGLAYIRGLRPWLWPRVYTRVEALALASRIYEGWGLGLGLAYIRGLRPRPWPRVYTRIEALALASRIYEGWGLGLGLKILSLNFPFSRYSRSNGKNGVWETKNGTPEAFFGLEFGDPEEIVTRQTETLSGMQLYHHAKFHADWWPLHRDVYRRTKTLYPTKRILAVCWPGACPRAS